MMYNATQEKVLVKVSFILWNRKVRTSLSVITVLETFLSKCALIENHTFDKVITAV